MSQLSDRTRRRKAPRRKRRIPDELLKQRETAAAAAAAAAADKAAWDRACNEVTASILSDQIHKIGRYQVNPRQLDKAMRERIPAAKKEMAEHGHPIERAGCTCRHLALISVGARQQSEITHVPAHVFFDDARSVLEAYLDRRS